jgi:Transposase DDE domain
LVVDCVDAQEPPFSKGTLIAFRKRLIETHMDRRLIERTMELAQQTGGFGPGPLRAALDSSPLWGSSRVEDTYNLLGHALRKALGVIARKPRRGLAELATEADAPVLGGSSLKAALDRDWDDAAEREQALVVVLETLNAVEQWLDSQPEGHDDPVVHYSMAAAQQVKQQDVEFPEIGNATLRKGVAKDRPITIEDAHMRHGRKSRRVRIDGYKRHVVRDLDSGLVRAVGITAANAAQASVAEAISADLACQQVTLSDLHIDRAYLSSSLVRQRSADLQVYCQAWPVRNGTHFPKTAFHLDWQQQRIRCPHAQELPFEPGGVGHFPSDICAACPLRDRCTSSPHGRSVSIHPDEQLLWELRQRPVTPQGRTKLRERVAVEHALAHIGRWQGRRARYRGVRKNLFDLRRTAVVHNLHVIARLPARLQIA